MYRGFSLALLGWSFLGAALSFAIIQICAVSELALYFRRYPGVEGKMKIVPGLREKMERAQLDQELGMLPPPTVNKGHVTSSPLKQSEMAFQYDMEPLPRAKLYRYQPVQLL